MEKTILAEVRERPHLNFRGSNAAVKIMQSPQWIFDNMNPDLKEKVQQILAWYQAERKHTLIARYDLGLIVKDIFDNDPAAGTGPYGYQAMERVCQVLKGIDDGLIYACLHMVQCYTRKEVEELATLQNLDGRPLTWTHVRTLVRVKNPNQRAELLQRTLDDSWTVTELEQQYRTLVKGPAEPRGRKLAVPKNLDGALLQQGTLADKYLARSEHVWGLPEHNLLELASEACPSEITEQKVQALKEHAEKLRRLAQLAVRHAEEAETVYRKYSDILSRRLPAPTAADEDEDEDEMIEPSEADELVPGDLADEKSLVRFPVDENEPDGMDEDAGEVKRMDCPLVLGG
jgi:hypothetical protein